MDVPIFITCRDRLQPLIGLVDYLERAGHDRIYLVDNDSGYPPLLEYFASSPHHVIRVGRNVGQRALWDANILADLGITGRFLLSDPDVVPLPECPLDALDYLDEILARYPDRTKAGLGLKIDDLPQTYKFREEVLVWESQFWERPMGPRLYDAAVATTFALYRGPAPYSIAPAIRTGYPYMARHMPWYVDECAVPDDEAYYRRHAGGTLVNHWGAETLPKWLAQAVEERQSRSSRSRLDQGPAPEPEHLLRMTAWCGEPEPIDEVQNTPWCEPGWHSWNNMSPEVEVCDFIVALVRLLKPRTIVETGVGQGFVARRVEAVLPEGQRLLCFESDQTWRHALGTLAFFRGDRCALAPDETPSDELLATADLCLIDSGAPHRRSEIERWSRVAREGAVIFVHDAGNGHGPDTPHARTRATLRELEIPGFFLANPRGAFVGVKRSSGAGSCGGHSTSVELLERLASVEGELLALRATKTFRYSAPLRRLYERLRSSGGR